MKMNQTEIKARANRLRNAVSEMFAIKVSQAQAYELIAKEENYPNWDAAAKYLKNPPAPAAPDEEVGALISMLGQDRWERINTMRAGLVLVGGRSFTGRSTLIGSIVKTLSRSMRNHLLSYGHTTDLPFNRAAVDPRQWADRIEQLMRMAPDLVVIDEIRDCGDADFAIGLALSGTQVVAGMHGHGAEQVYARLRALLDDKSRVGLETLLQAHRVVEIHMERISPSEVRAN